MHESDDWSRYQEAIHQVKIVCDYDPISRDQLLECFEVSTHPDGSSFPAETLQLFEWIRDHGDELLSHMVKVSMLTVDESGKYQTSDISKLVLRDSIEDGKCRFKAVIFDHDVTIVDSSLIIHHAAHVEIMKRLRPNITPCTLAEWLSINNQTDGHPSFGFTAEERAIETELWAEFARDAPIHDFYEGFVNLVAKLQRSGVVVIICTHSNPIDVERQYDDTYVTPIFIYGGTGINNKPHPFPVLDTVQQFDLKSVADVCVVDGMSSGIKMALAVGAVPVCAAWGTAFCMSQEVREYMTENVAVHCHSVQDLDAFLFPHV
jgi:phosphoglycolate phosphatase/pyrophosphatase PpaX